MADISSLSLTNVEFALDLYHKLSASKPDSNLFYSPISISFALAMTYLGADGKTKAEMNSVMKFDKISSKPGVTPHSLLKELNDHLLDTKGLYTLHIANRLYGEKSHNFLHDFMENCKMFYGAEMETVDFKNKADECEIMINNWIENKTQNKIKKLIPPGVLNELTCIVLVNAIYFKGNWNDKFDAQNTKMCDFHVDKNKKVEVPFMHFDTKELNYYFNQELNSQILELPYTNNIFSFIVILPDLSKTNLFDVEKMLSAEKLFNISKKLYSVDVKLWIPKFNLESCFEITDLLKELGMVDLFTKGSADLSNMSESNDLYVSRVLHKAFVEVNEEGSEAAAATGIVVSTECLRMPSKPVVVRVDHPFIFLIKDNKSGTILFLGKLLKP